MSGRLVAVDRVSGDGPVPVIGCDVTDPAFADLLAVELTSYTRAELYHTAGWVPPLARVDDTPTDAFATAVTQNLTSAYAALQGSSSTRPSAGTGSSPPRPSWPPPSAGASTPAASPR
ncbi:MAG: hypothetical protein ACRDUV_20340 [Pseudonocardiaceae bacterium]